MKKIIFILLIIFFFKLNPMEKEQDNFSYKDPRNIYDDLELNLILKNYDEILKLLPIVFEYINNLVIYIKENITPENLNILSQNIDYISSIIKILYAQSKDLYSSKKNSLTTKIYFLYQDIFKFYKNICENLKLNKIYLIPDELNMLYFQINNILLGHKLIDLLNQFRQA